jgi:hypothetical protein
MEPPRDLPWCYRCGITSAAPPGRRQEAGGGSAGEAGALEDVKKVSTRIRLRQSDLGNPTAGDIGNCTWASDAGSCPTLAPR